MAGYIELSIDKGADFETVIRISDDDTGANVNIASYNVQSQMRRSYYAANAVPFTVTKTDAGNGEFTLALNSANTSNLKSGKYLFDVIYTVDSATTRFLEGIVHINPSVTR